MNPYCQPAGADRPDCCGGPGLAGRTYTGHWVNSSISGVCNPLWSAAQRRGCDDPPQYAMGPDVKADMRTASRRYCGWRRRMIAYIAIMFCATHALRNREESMSNLAKTDILFFERAGMDRMRIESTVAQA